MARHADLYPLLLPFVPGCPYPTVDLAISRAAGELCEQSRAWEEALSPIALSEGVEAYEIDLPSDSVLVCVRNVQLNGRDLHVNPSWPALVASSSTLAHATPSHYAMRGNELVVRPIPSPEAAGGVVTLVATLKPSISATSLPDVLVSEHMAAVCEGAKSFLKEMTGAAWFDPSGAAMANQRFRDAIARARISVEHGRAAGSLSVAPRHFGQG